MNWYHLSLGAEEVAAGKVESLKEEFGAAFRSAGGPRTMALFQRENAAGGTDLYFTPECASHALPLLEKYAATVAESPSLVGLELLVGHNEITYYLTT